MVSPRQPKTPSEVDSPLVLVTRKRLAALNTVRLLFIKALICRAAKRIPPGPDVTKMLLLRAPLITIFSAVGSRPASAARQGGTLSLNPFLFPLAGLQSDEAEGEAVSDDDFMDGPPATRRKPAADGHRVQQREAKVWSVPLMNDSDANLKAARILSPTLKEVSLPFVTSQWLYWLEKSTK